MSRRERESTPATKAFADHLSDLLAESKSHDHLSYSEIGSRIGVSAASLSEWASDRKTATIDKLANLCSYYNVSADWLLGLSPVSSSDTSIKDICEKTGLSEDAYYSLSLLKENPGWVSVINKLLTSKEFRVSCVLLGKLMQDIDEARQYEESVPYQMEDVRIEGEIHSGKVIYGYDICSLQYQEVANRIPSIIEEISGMKDLRALIEKKRYAGLIDMLSHTTFATNDD